MTRYLDDFEAGSVEQLGRFELSEAEIIEFAARYDPQPLHVDPEAAEGLAFGGLIASGWQTASACMRLVVDGVLGDAASMGALGLDELRWPAPVRPGDEVSVSLEVLDVRESTSRDDRGYARNRVEGRTADDTVLVWVATNVIGRRPG